LRRRVCARLHGEVVEIGFGSGFNVAFYPPEVSGVAAVDPSDVGWRLAAKRVGEARIPIRRAGPDAQSLPLPDHSVDSALSTWSMCTVPDLDAALGELRRVLRPGGTLHFVEHGLAPDESVQRWQHRLDRVHARLVGGCHLDRPVVARISAAGFDIAELDVFYQPGGPRFLLAESLGTAVSR
jgi:ubiquinone/menaquinone biosynthesis C-methylase UbiE